MINSKIPFAFWQFRDLELLVNAVGRVILVGRLFRCLLSNEGGYGSSKQLKDKHGSKIQICPIFVGHRSH